MTDAPTPLACALHQVVLNWIGPSCLDNPGTLAEVEASLIGYLTAAGYVVVPREPTRGLLVSMAIRYRHDFGLEQYTPLSGVKIGLSESEKASLLSTMAQLHEEVVGTGFYRPAKEAYYATTFLLPAGPIAEENGT